MLLDLPLELIQLVLLNCTTPAFLQAAVTCRALYRIASSSREALVFHLQQTPGFGLDASSLSTNKLLPILKGLASQQLYGSQFYATSSSFNFGEQVLDVKASNIVSSIDETLILSTCRDQKVVNVFRLQNGKLSLLSKITLPWNQPGHVEVLKTGFDGDDTIYILQRFTPSIDEHDSDADHPFVKQAIQTGRDGMLYLTCHSLQMPDDPIRMCAFHDYQDYEPLALAVTYGDTFAISWRDRFFPQSSVILYSRLTETVRDTSSNIVGLSYQTSLLKSWSNTGSTQEQGPVITDLEFNDRSSQLLYYYQAKTLYGSFQKINSSTFPSMYENRNLVQFSDSLNLLFAIGIPFFGTHETQNQGGFETCRWRYLALGIATHRQENWTVACLLRSEAVCRSSNCGHMLNLERGRRLTDWTVTARLWGFKNATNSLGCKVATSKHGTRIAVANWNTIYVWALEPGALIDLNQNGYYPSSWRSPTSGMIELQPILLKLNAVCFQLRFTDKENELVAITDQGIMLWDLSPSGRGTQTCQELKV